MVSLKTAAATVALLVAVPGIAGDADWKKVGQKDLKSGSGEVSMRVGPEDGAFRWMKLSAEGGKVHLKMKTLHVAMTAALVAAASPAQAADPMKAFPEPGKRMVRFVLQFPKEADEDGMMVQIIAGKTVEVDEGNQYRFGGSIQAENIKGWGYTRYVVSQLGPMTGTRLAIDPAEPKVKRFVAMGGKPYLVRYNSKLPLVVYAPEGVEVRYRVWRAAPESRSFENG